MLRVLRLQLKLKKKNWAKRRKQTRDEKGKKSPRLRQQKQQQHACSVRAELKIEQSCCPILLLNSNHRIRRARVKVCLVPVWWWYRLTPMTAARRLTGSGRALAGLLCALPLPTLLSCSLSPVPSLLLLLPRLPLLQLQLLQLLLHPHRLLLAQCLLVCVCVYVCSTIGTTYSKTTAAATTTTDSRSQWGAAAAARGSGNIAAAASGPINY